MTWTPSPDCWLFPESDRLLPCDEFDLDLLAERLSPDSDLNRFALRFSLSHFIEMLSRSEIWSFSSSSSSCLVSRFDTRTPLSPSKSSTLSNPSPFRDSLAATLWLLAATLWLPYVFLGESSSPSITVVAVVFLTYASLLFGVTNASLLFGVTRHFSTGALISSRGNALI